MSGLIQFTQAPPPLGNVGLQGNSDVLQPVDYRNYDAVTTETHRWSDVLWPRSRLRGSLFESSHRVWEWNSQMTGGHVPKKVTGVTFNANGDPLAGATVSLFNTATGLLVDTQISDSAGNYQCGDPNAVACFAVAYKAGSPDIAAATVNTLLGG